MAEEHHEQESGISFTAFVLSLAHTAAVHFGDIPDPVTGQQGSANLPAAQQMIDILSLLEAKTRGNLTAEERQFLEQVLYELRLRFVEARAGGTEPKVPPSGSRTESGIIIP
jgi:Domain of unknown function (DUF1844)